ncbi:hypothetical protein, partial [Acinetobacter baumannii]|uniref:hypothetical protein n=1 Tax=Acinetobacter baumannii TaxID=470 RepID=UPI00339A7D11
YAGRDISLEAQIPQIFPFFILNKLRKCVTDFEGNWDDHPPLIEISYNNNYHSSISIAPFEPLHGRRCRFSVGWLEVGEFALLGLEVVYEAKG